MTECRVCHRDFRTDNRSPEKWYQVNHFFPDFTGLKGDQPTTNASSWNLCSLECLEKWIAPN